MDYEIPRQIGADRLANVLGAYALGHQQGVVIDLGTATTFDVFGDYSYCGGIICPGIHTSLRSLAQSAAKLSEVELKWTSTAIGKTTDDALRIGMLMGTLGQVEYLLKAIIKEKGMRNPSIIATGGLAPLLGERSKSIRIIEPDLTLIGINHLLVGKAKQRKRKK
jgi:type III pantothenate kinase